MNDKRTKAVRRRKAKQVVQKYGNQKARDFYKKLFDWGPYDDEVIASD